MANEQSHQCGGPPQAGGHRRPARGPKDRTRRGRARCPLHGGENPQAFNVTRDGQRFTCFACGARGDVIDLAQRLDGVDFKTAAARLTGGEVQYLDPVETARRAKIARRCRVLRQWRTVRLTQLAEDLCDLDADLDLCRDALRMCRSRGFTDLEAGFWQHLERIVIEIDAREWLTVQLTDSPEIILARMWLAEHNASKRGGS